ncbi:hypothetical protein [Brevibacillus migulae]|uniref:hypothetical protein n=1 Tax=Brevibacillus migulae TaxID=1644114 RepID=UPI00106E65DF|nr:hypothetical protein [Brevibacillus migulae]
MEIYVTEVDAAGISIADPISTQETRHLFTQPFVYQVYPEFGSFRMTEEMKQTHPIQYQCSKKCLSELFDYLRRNMEAGEEIELYSCWANEHQRFPDTPKKELELLLQLSAFQLKDEFEWKERQLIRVIK